MPLGVLGLQTLIRTSSRDYVIDSNHRTCSTIYATTDYINFWGTISHAIRDQVIVVVLCRGVDNFCVTMCASSYLNLPIESVLRPDPTQLTQCA